MKVLYPDQRRVLDDIRDAIRGGAKAPLLQLATGGGKTVLGCRLIRQWEQGGGSVWVLVHRQELERQWRDELAEIGVVAGTIRGSAAPLGSAVQVCSVPTLAKRIRAGKVPKVSPMHAVITDEAHHAPAKSYQAVYGAVDATHLGLTATPARLDGKPLGDCFDALIEGPTPAELIAAGRLADYEILTLPIIERGGMRRRGGDFARGEASARVKAKVQDIGRVWERYAQGKRCLVFATSREDGRAICDRLRQVGADARYCDGATPSARRASTMADFQGGAYNCLVTVDLIGEGFDAPGADCAILARPTESVTIHLQQIGRVLRRDGDKQALILDCVGNTRHLGGPRTPRKWSLTGRVETDLSGAEKPFVASGGKRCEKCGTISPPGATVCVGCLRGFKAQPMLLAERLVMIDDSTVKIHESKPGTWARRDVARALAKCNGADDVYALARQLGYTRRWAEVRWDLRKAAEKKRRPGPTLWPDAGRVG